jgi:hypothetical protein
VALSDLVEERDYLDAYGVKEYLPRCIAKLEELVGALVSKVLQGPVITRQGQTGGVTLFISRAGISHCRNFLETILLPAYIGVRN